MQFCRRRKRRPTNGLAMIDFCRQKSLDDKAATESDKGDFRSRITPYKNRFSTSSGAAAYVLGVIEQLARPWLKLRMALE